MPPSAVQTVPLSDRKKEIGKVRAARNENVRQTPILNRKWIENWRLTQLNHPPNVGRRRALAVEPIENERNPASRMKKIASAPF